MAGFQQVAKATVCRPSCQHGAELPGPARASARGFDMGLHGPARRLRVVPRREGIECDALGSRMGVSASDLMGSPASLACAYTRAYSYFIWGPLL
jgi:hypothetical protein